MNLNKIFLIGRLTKDPETKTTPSGQMVCNLGLATNRIWNNQNKERQEQTEYHNIVLWRRLAEIASQYLAKGSLVLIEGRIQTRTWQDQAGNKKYKTEVIAENIQLGPKPISQPSFQPKNINTAFNQPSQSLEKEKITKEEIPIIEEDAPPSASLTSEHIKNNEDEQEIDIKDIPF